MNLLASKIAAAIKDANPEDTYSVEIMQYSLGIILNTLIIILVTAILGLVTGNFAPFMMFLFSFCLLRLASGGFHLKTARACNIVTILLSTLLPYFLTLTGQLLWIINIICLFIIILFAPNPDIHARIPQKMYPVLKLTSILLVCLNFFFHSSVIGLAFFVQSLTVIPWTRGDEQ